MANQILAGAVFHAGQVIAGVDADNPPYVGPPIPTYLMALVREGNRTSGSFEGQERLYMYDVYNIEADPIVINNPNGDDANQWGGYYDYFGQKKSVVASNNDKLFIGAPYEDLDGPDDQGVIYIYDKSNLTAPVSTITSPSPSGSGYFGQALACNDTQLFVSESGDQTVFVYDLSDLSASPTVISDTRPPANSQWNFAAKMEATNTHLVIADDNYDNSSTSSTNHGSVSIYDLSDLSSPIHLTDEDLQGACSWMGLRISNDGSQFYVGVNASYNPNNSTNHYGQMQIRDITTGNLVSTINYPAPNNNWAAFASSIVETDDKFILSAMLEKVGDDTQQGRVYVYDKSNLSSPSMILTSPLSNNTDQGSDRFSESMVSDGDYLYVSDRHGAGAGSVYQVWNATGAYIWKYDLNDLSAAPYQITEPAVARAEHVSSFGGDLKVVQFPFPPPPAPPSANWVVVGATWDDDNGNTNSGSVYVYDANDLSAQPTKLTAFDGAQQDEFGASVQATADKIIVASPRDDDDGEDSGSVYIYDANDLSAQPTKLTAFDGAGSDRFGLPTAYYGDKMIVGAYTDDDNGLNSGSVYVYDANDLSAQPTKLTAFDGAPTDYFGFAVTGAGDKIIVGAWLDDDGGESSGSVYVYDANDLSAQPTKLTSFDANAADLYGYSVAATADKIVVSSILDDDNGNINSGSVYVYDANDLTAQPTKLTAFDGATDAQFGSKVVTTADKIVVAARYDTVGSIGYAGSVYVYDANDLTAQPTKLTAFDAYEDDQFGYSIGAAADKIIVASPLDDDNGTNSGSVYVYDANDLSAQPTKLTAFDGAEGDNFGVSVAVG